MSRTGDRGTRPVQRSRVSRKAGSTAAKQVSAGLRSMVGRQRQKRPWDEAVGFSWCSSGRPWRGQGSAAIRPLPRAKIKRRRNSAAGAFLGVIVIFLIQKIYHGPVTPVNLKSDYAGPRLGEVIRFLTADLGPM